MSSTRKMPEYPGPVCNLPIAAAAAAAEAAEVAEVAAAAEAAAAAASGFGGEVVEAVEAVEAVGTAGYGPALAGCGLANESAQTALKKAPATWDELVRADKQLLSDAEVGLAGFRV
jgi:hypothetical protein